MLSCCPCAGMRVRSGRNRLATAGPRLRPTGPDTAGRAARGQPGFRVRALAQARREASKAAVPRQRQIETAFADFIADDVADLIGVLTDLDLGAGPPMGRPGRSGGRWSQGTRAGTSGPVHHTKADELARKIGSKCSGRAERLPDARRQLSARRAALARHQTAHAVRISRLPRLVFTRTSRLLSAD